MNCNKFQDERILFAYGELEDAKGFEAHMASCAACSNAVEEYRVGFSGTRSLPDAPAASLSSERLRQAILSNELKPQRSPWFVRLGTVGASVAAIAAVWIVVDRGFGQNAMDAPVVIRDTNVPFAVAPSTEKHGDKIEFSAVPETVTKVTSGQVPSKSARTYHAASTRRNLPDVVAVAGSGVSEAMDVYSESRTSNQSAPAVMSGSPSEKSDVVIIQPDGSGASERSSDDLAIGG